MKPAWDKLADEFDGNQKITIADVDCTAAGKSLCEKMEVKGYPSIKYWMPEDEEPTDYNGGRDFDSLQKFTADTWKAGCKVGSLVNCSPNQKTMIEKWKPLGLDHVQDELVRIDNLLDNKKEEKSRLIDEGKEGIKGYKNNEGTIQAKLKIMKKVLDRAMLFEEL